MATAKSPAMLIYLDNFDSADPAAVRRMDAEKAMRRARYGGAFAGGQAPTPGTFPGPVTSTSAPGAAATTAAKKQERGLNENYGREVMELHTVGVDGGYTQQDVIQMAECLTGWTVRTPRNDPEFFFDDRIHAQGKKVVMGRTFSYGGEKDGEEALKMLANHPNTAKFISMELARHFVSDDPPQALVHRMAEEFSATQGDIRSVLRTMIYSPGILVEGNLSRKSEDAVRAGGQHRESAWTRKSPSLCRRRSGWRGWASRCSFVRRPMDIRTRRKHG